MPNEYTTTLHVLQYKRKSDKLELFGTRDLKQLDVILILDEVDMLRVPRQTDQSEAGKVA